MLRTHCSTLTGTVSESFRNHEASFEKGGEVIKNGNKRKSTTAATFFFILQQSDGEAPSRVGGNGNNLVWGEFVGFGTDSTEGGGSAGKRIQSHLHNPITAKSKNKWRPGSHPLPGGNSVTFRRTRWLRKGRMILEI